MFRRTIVILLIGIVAWAYQEMCPPPPKLCGLAPGGSPVTGRRIKLMDGRYLAYMELGAPKDVAKYNIILVHGFGHSKFVTVVSKELLEEMGAHLVTFDRPGYGETFGCIVIQTSSGNTFEAYYGLEDRVICFSPSLLAGVALLAPVVNYWWPSFPANLSTEAYYEQYLQDQWALRVSHYTPWLIYWWNTQKLFPRSSVASGRPKFSRQDYEILTRLAVTGKQIDKQEYATQQGKFESQYRDLIIGFGKQEFDPMDLKNPIPDKNGSVHLCQGDGDGLVPVTLQRYIARKLPWIRYHELAGAGHLFPLDKYMGEAIFKKLLLGKNQPIADK